MRSKFFISCFNCILVLSASVATTRGQIAHLTLDSQPGDFIGLGGHYDITYTPANPQSAFSAQVRRTVGTAPAELLFVMGRVTGGSDNTFSTLFFGTDQLAIPMQPGVYQNAQRADFASPGHPGLDVSFQNRGCNTVSGNFTVTEALFAPDNSIQSFSVSFEQHCEGGAAALFGTFTYVVPEPSSVTFFCLAGLFAFARAVRRHR